MANSIDSNADCTRLVVDGWLELVISDNVSALKVLSSALKMRDKWDNLLQAKLSQSGLRSSAVLGLAGAIPNHYETEKVEGGLLRFLLYTEVMGHPVLDTCCLHLFQIARQFSYSYTGWNV